VAAFRGSHQAVVGVGGLVAVALKDAGVAPAQFVLVLVVGRDARVRAVVVVMGGPTIGDVAHVVVTSGEGTMTPAVIASHFLVCHAEGPSTWSETMADYQSWRHSWSLMRSICMDDLSWSRLDSCGLTVTASWSSSCAASWAESSTGVESGANALSGSWSLVQVYSLAGWMWP